MNKIRKHKKYFSLLMCLTALVLLLSSGFQVSAENAQKVSDQADLLTDEEEAKLQERLTEIAQEYQCDVVAATADSCEGKSPQDYTDDFYYENGYGYGEDIDGIILMICMEERKFHLATRGEAMEIFTDYGLEVIDEHISEYLTDGEYYEAFRTYADMAEEFIVEAVNNQPYDTNHEYSEPMGVGTCILISLAAGLVAALITLLVLRGQLKSVSPKNRAEDYIRNGSFRVKRERDVFLYRTVERRKIEKNSSGGGSSSHSTSDGGSAGGHTGSF